MNLYLYQKNNHKPKSIGQTRERPLKERFAKEETMNTVDEILEVNEPHTERNKENCCCLKHTQGRNNISIGFNRKTY